MKNTVFPHKFWRPFLDCMPQLFFRPQYVWFPVHLKGHLIPLCYETLVVNWQNWLFTLFHQSRSVLSPNPIMDPILVITFLSMAQPMKLDTNSPNLCHQKMHIILFWTWRTYRKLVLYTKVKLISNLFFLNCTYPRNVHIIKCHPNDTLPMSYI